MHDPSQLTDHAGRSEGITWALLGERCVHVSEVPRGRVCGCRCFGCGQALVARKGAVRAAHFSHLADTECLGAPESALHRAAKRILSELDRINLPEYRYRPFFERKTWKALPDGGVVVPATEVQIDRCEIEVTVGSIRPDVLLWKGERCLAVEIVVTNAPRRAKVRAYRRLQQSALEIRLDRGGHALDPEDLRRRIRDDLAGKRWIFHRNQTRHQGAFLASTRAARAERKRAIDEALNREIQRIKPSVPSRATTGRDPRWLSFERWADRVIAETGRQPTLEEYRALRRRPRI